MTLPAGVTEGQSLRLAGQGEPAVGKGRAGDLYLTVHIRPHRNLELDGRDVKLTLPVAPWEAALGATLTVPTLGGPVDLRIPAQSQSGSRLRLRGRGLAGDPPGDQYVVLKVVLPPADTPAARKLYERMRRTGLRSARQPLASRPAAARARQPGVFLGCGASSTRLRRGKRPKRATMP